MSISETLVKEFEVQAPITRRFLERLPDEKLSWKPHAKSMSAGQLAYHLASIPGSIVRAVQNDSAQAPDFTQFPQPATREEILNAFDESVVAVKTLLPKHDDKFMKATWRLTAGAREVFAVPREQFVRDVMLSHWYQHRGQFSVYLRMLDVPVPASWGPSADEPSLFMPLAKSA